MISLAEIVRGSRFLLLSLGTRDEHGHGNFPFFELRDQLARQQPEELLHLDRLLARTKDHGPPFGNRDARRLSASALCEFRTRRGTRLFWIYGPKGTIICLSGYRKQAQEIPRRELQRAQAWHRAYLRFTEGRRPPKLQPS